MEKWIKPAFSVIGLEGSTEDGAGFVQRLWQEHPGKCGGGLAGVLLGICILVFGFWNMLFILARAGFESYSKRMMGEV